LNPFWGEEGVCLVYSVDAYFNFMLDGLFIYVANFILAFCTGHVQRMEQNRIPKRVLYMNLGTTRLRGRPGNRWQDEVREDGRIVGGEGWQEKST
jgi:hypothetical protein